MLKGTGIAVSTPLQVTLAALILGKAVLIADTYPGSIAIPTAFQRKSYHRIEQFLAEVHHGSGLYR